MKGLKRQLSLLTLIALLSIMVLPGSVLAAPGAVVSDIQTEVSEDVTVNQFLSAEYLLFDNEGGYWRLGLVSVDVDEMNHVGGAFYNKGGLGPVLDSWVYGTMVETVDEEGKEVVQLDAEWYWGGEGSSVEMATTTNEEGETVNYVSGNPMGEVNITFWMEGGVPAGVGYWNYYEDIEDAYGYDYEEEVATANREFVLVESARSQYAKEEAAEISAEVEACLAIYEGTAEEGTECELGVNPAELTPEEVFAAEYLLVDQGAFGGQRVSITYLDQEELQAYGLPATYNTAGVWYTRGEVPYPNRVLVGSTTLQEGGELFFKDYLGNVELDNIEVYQTLTFDGVWFNLGDGDVLYDLVGEIGDEEADMTFDDAYYYGGDAHIDFRQVVFGSDDAERKLYMVTCDGYITDQGYTYPFMCGETGRSKHAQSEVKELEEEILTYMEDVDEEDIEEVVIEEETVDETSVESEDGEAVEEEEMVAEEEIEQEQEEYIDETYEDVEEDVWYAEYIDSELWSGVGCPNGRGQCFDGSAPVLRAQAAKLVKAVLDKRGIVRDAQSCSSSFDDVAAGQWYAAAVEALNCMGIMTGKSDGSNFEPGAKMNRAEAATVLARALGGSDVLLSYYNTVLGRDCGANQFVDLQGKEEEWYYDTAGVMACMGIITGIEHEDGMYFEPETQVNRSQFAAMLGRATKYNAYGYKSGIYPIASDGTYPYLVLVSITPETMDSCDFYPGPDVESVSVVSVDGEVSYLGASVSWMLMNDNLCNSKKGIQAMMGQPGYGPRGNNGYTSMGSGFAVFETDIDLMNADGVVVTEVGDSDEEVEDVYLYAAADPGDPASWVYLGVNSIGGTIEEDIDDGGAEGSIEEQDLYEEDTTAPDLAVISIWAGEDYIYYTIGNIGDEDVSEDLVDDVLFTVDSSSESQVYYTYSASMIDDGVFLMAGGSHEGAAYILTENMDVTVCIDSMGVVTDDADTSNNCMTETFEVESETTIEEEALNFFATLSGEDQGIETEATGMGAFVLEGNSLSYSITVESLFEDITGVHFHDYPSGGTVEVTLEIAGDVLTGKWLSNGVVDLTDEQVKELKAGSWYVNVHTSDNPNGEISGFIFTDDEISGSILSQ